MATLILPRCNILLILRQPESRGKKMPQMPQAEKCHKSAKPKNAIRGN
jgi:hypothetical protein